MVRLAGAAAAGYLLGTIPSARIAARLATHGETDVSLAGTGNPGAANAAAVLGKKWGLAVLLTDVGKGATASAVGRRIAGPNGAHLAGTAAVAGHCFPVWARFRGGKGAAASCGQCLATFPAYFPVDIGVAYCVAKWRQKPLPATAAASALWVAAATVWWRRQWPNLWGPRPSAALPAAAAASSAMILYKFWAAPRAARAS